jgi:hypothetical protein
MARNPVAKNLNVNRASKIEGRRHEPSPPDVLNCMWCGKFVEGEVWADYVAGHLQCECGRNVSECCSGEGLE